MRSRAHARCASGGWAHDGRPGPGSPRGTRCRPVFSGVGCHARGRRAWQIIVTFVQGAAEHGAHWHLSNSGILEAIDQEAQWLTEQVSSSPTASIFTPLTRPAPAPDPDEEDLRTREALIDQLNAARGKRQQIEIDLGDAWTRRPSTWRPSPRKKGHRTPSPSRSTGPISARIYSLASARTKVDPAEQEDVLFSAAPELPAPRPP